MAQEYEHKISQGVAFYLEFVLRDEAGEFEDLANATPSVQISDGITEADITVAKTGGPGIITLTALSAVTALWPVGIYDIQLLLTWSPFVDVDVEKILTVRLTIREAL